MGATLGKLAVGPVPRVVGTISQAATLEKLQFGVVRPCDIAEVRLDLVGPDHPDWPARCRAIEAQGVPVIFTLRLAAEGGRWSRPDSERAPLFAAALPAVSAVDVELQSPLLRDLVKLAQGAGKALIVSAHDFERTPSYAELEDLVAEAATHATIVKVATMLQRADDANRLRKLLTVDWGVPLCVLGMGPKAAKTRTEFPRRGSCLAYGYLDEAAAPGQPPAAELRQQLQPRRPRPPAAES
ncbi:type I 3-dehydroquinate dehydratase [bacterium]|nr:type I 3-dehydroquinate dehydratase [bacterium]